jgi:PIN domain nuclease of toxin-antitoxin system
MRLLLDSHVILWAMAKPERLPASVVAAMGDPDVSVHLSVASVWELALKQSIGRLDEDVWAAVDASPFRLLPVTVDHIRRLSTLPMHHRDPFDRIIVAQALAEDMSLATADRAIRAYGVPVLA